MRAWIVLISLSLFSPLYAASSSDVPLQKAKVNVNDKASLQRGAKLYMESCAGCHAMDYLRYNRMAKDIGVTDYQGNPDRERMEQDYIFTDLTLNDTVQTALTNADAEQWFNIKVPDLSLVARVRGADWLYTYLTSFYRDDSRPYGTNNWLFPDVAMPNVLESLQGTVVPRYKTITVMYDGEEREIQKIDSLRLIAPGTMDSPQFQLAVNDIVNFLVYAGEPIQAKRKKIGYWVLAFLFLLCILTYLLKKEYWRDIKKRD